MTAHPDPYSFVSTPPVLTKSDVFMRPNVTERFWGYEISPSEQVIDIAVLLRAMCGFTAVTTFIVAIGVWVMPMMAFSASAVTAKVMVSILLMCLAFVLARIAARGTRVRVQIDTAAGELREVVDGMFGADVVLAHYGFDSVEKIDVIPSRTNSTCGQVQILIKGVGVLPAGEGALVLLGALRSRLATDCGLDIASNAREAVWGGPIAA